MAPRTRRRIVGLLVAAGLVGLTLAFIVHDRSPRLPLPNPNGYDDFVAAGKLAAGRIPQQLTFDHEQLREAVATNAEVLRLMRLGLSRQCSVPTESALTNVAGWQTELASVSGLAKLLADEARLRELEGRPGEAALVCCEIIRFGNEMSRGGFLSHRFVGSSREAIGCHELARLVPKLEPRHARAVVAELEEVDRDRVAWGPILRNERRLCRATTVWGLNPVDWLKHWLGDRDSGRRGRVRHDYAVAKERLLLTELALRCCLSERGQAPADLGTLVPDYLSAVPGDPFSRKPLVFRPQGTNWLLYSVGTDGVDDGGKDVVYGLAGKGDILFSTRN